MCMLCRNILINLTLSERENFDIQIYALVTNYNPLPISLYRSGFARFTKVRYSNDPSDIANSIIHLS